MQPILAGISIEKFINILDAQLKTNMQVYTHTQESKHRHVAEELNKVLEDILNSETHDSGEDKAI